LERQFLELLVGLVRVIWTSDSVRIRSSNQHSIVIITAYELIATIYAKLFHSFELLQIRTKIALLITTDKFNVSMQAHISMCDV
jgi:hypothetical protein